MFEAIGGTPTELSAASTVVEIEYEETEDLDSFLKATFNEKYTPVEAYITGFLACQALYLGSTEFNEHETVVWKALCITEERAEKMRQVVAKAMEVAEDGIVDGFGKVIEQIEWIEPRDGMYLGYLIQGLY